MTKETIKKNEETKTVKKSTSSPTSTSSTKKKIAERNTTKTQPKKTSEKSNKTSGSVASKKTTTKTSAKSSISKNSTKSSAKTTTKKTTSKVTKNKLETKTTTTPVKNSSKIAEIKSTTTKSNNSTTNGRKKIERNKEIEKKIITPSVPEMKEAKEEINLHNLEKNEPDLSKTIVLKIDNDKLSNKEVEEKKDTKEIITTSKEVKETNRKETSKTILGVDLPSGNTAEDRKERKHFYLKDSFIFALIIPIIDLFAMLFIEDYTCILFTNNTVLNYIATLLIDFSIIFLVTYIIDYILGESSIKKSNK